MDCASEIIFLMDAIAHFNCPWNDLARFGQRPSLNLESLYCHQAVWIGNPWDDINGRFPHPTLTVAQKILTSLASSGLTILLNQASVQRMKMSSSRCPSGCSTSHFCWEAGCGNNGTAVHADEAAVPGLKPSDLQSGIQSPKKLKAWYWINNHKCLDKKFNSQARRHLQPDILTPKKRITPNMHQIL